MVQDVLQHLKDGVSYTYDNHESNAVDVAQRICTDQYKNGKDNRFCHTYPGVGQLLVTFDGFKPVLASATLCYSEAPQDEKQ